MASAPLLEARRITKRFPGVTALSDVNFDLRAGEIHALCGENGAGKSTLIKLLSGLHPSGSYEGDLVLDDRVVHFTSIADAQSAGIAVIHQELALVPELSIAENLFLGCAPRRGLLVDWDKTHAGALALLARVGLSESPETPVGQLGVGHRQLVEIAKALSKNARLLILDEPTAALADHEVARLLVQLRELREGGIGCIYISHKLDEVFAVADRITVLRDGATISTHPTSATSRRRVIREMVGRDVAELFPRRPADPAHAAAAPVRLRVSQLAVAPARKAAARLRDVSFEVRAGEVLGLGGLMGAGRTELLLHLIGAWGVRLAGHVELGGRAFAAGSPADALAAGLALVSEDRKRYGLVLARDVGFNLSLSSLANLRRGALIDAEAEARANQGFVASLRIKAPSLASVVGTLSGGNQQKVVLGRALMTEPRVILLDEPTRGIDIGAKLEVYQLINDLTAAGKAVVLVSSELPELIGLSDRIVMLHDGRVGGTFTRGTATPEALLAAAMDHGRLIQGLSP